MAPNSPLSGRIHALKPQQARGEMQTLYVSRLSGDELHVEVEGECTVQQLTRRLAEIWRLQPTSLRLLQDVCVLGKGEIVDNLKGRKITTISVPTSEYGLGAGDYCQTLRAVTVRSTEALDGQKIGELPAGTVVQVVGVGEGRRLLVSGEGAQGWISFKTTGNIPLVARIADSNRFELELGQQYEVRRSTRLLASRLPSDHAELLADLAPRTWVIILEVLEAEDGEKSRVKSLASFGGLTEGRRRGSRIRVVVSSGGPHLGLDGWLPPAENPGSLLQVIGGGAVTETDQPEIDPGFFTTFLTMVQRVFDA